jgi:hypothetical protein
MRFEKILRLQLLELSAVDIAILRPMQIIAYQSQSNG